ncbi:MAG: hypothetical protein ACE5MK_08980 [Acidobacteriota bacterium]
MEEFHIALTYAGYAGAFLVLIAGVVCSCYALITVPTLVPTQPGNTVDHLKT